MTRNAAPSSKGLRMTSDRKTTTYEAPALRALGSVHELTQGGLGNASDGLLLFNKTVVVGSG
jgi:hypothetical protein